MLNLEWNLQHLAMLIHQEKKGVVKTRQLPNPGICTVESSHSYQFYGPAPSALGQQQQVLIVRLESISVHKLNGREELRGCHFTYADAALLEVYREATGKESLRGTFICPSPQEMKKQKVQDGEESKVEPLCTGVSGLSLK